MVKIVSILLLLCNHCKIEFGFRFRNFAAKSKDELVALGFPAFTVEDFHDTVSFWCLNSLILPWLI